MVTLLNSDTDPMGLAEGIAAKQAIIQETVWPMLNTYMTIS
jgi:hypothetical protein